MFRRLPVSVGLLLAPLLAGCHGSGDPSTEAPPAPITQATPRDTGAFQQTDPWLLTTTDPTVNRGTHGIFLGNGEIGTTFAASGGSDKDSVVFLAGSYDAKENLAHF